MAEPKIENIERYIGYGVLLELPSERVGIEITINQIEELEKEIYKLKQGEIKNIKVLILPVKLHNVKAWKTHTVKVGMSKYKNRLISER